MTTPVGGDGVEKVLRIFLLITAQPFLPLFLLKKTCFICIIPLSVIDSVIHPVY